MFTRQKISQRVSDNVGKMDFSVYPMTREVFIELMTDCLYDMCKEKELECDDITHEMFDEAEDFVCEQC